MLWLWNNRPSHNSHACEATAVRQTRTQLLETSVQGKRSAGFMMQHISVTLDHSWKIWCGSRRWYVSSLPTLFETCVRICELYGVSQRLEPGPRFLETRDSMLRLYEKLHTCMIGAPPCHRPRPLPFYAIHHAGCSLMRGAAYATLRLRPVPPI